MLKIQTSVKAGLGGCNHNQAVRVQSRVKAGGNRPINHNQAVRVQSRVKAGAMNHNQARR